MKRKCKAKSNKKIKILVYMGYKLTTKGDY